MKRWIKCVVQGSAVCWESYKVTDGYKSNGGQMNKFATNVDVTSDSVSGPASSQMLQIFPMWVSGDLRFPSAPTSIQIVLAPSVHRS
ncbi:hypothetical protein Tco_1163339 [Tanacetum coccineum]